MFILIGAREQKWYHKKLETELGGQQKKFGKKSKSKKIYNS